MRFTLSLSWLNLMLLIANLANKNDAGEIETMTETLAHVYSSESSQRKLSNEYQHNRVRSFSKVFVSLSFGRRLYHTMISVFCFIPIIFGIYYINSVRHLTFFLWVFSCDIYCHFDVKK